MRVLVAVALVAAAVVAVSGFDQDALDCNLQINQDQPRCKPREGPAKIPGADEVSNLLRDLLEKFMKGIDDSRHKKHIWDSYKQMLFIRDVMAARQEEIDFIVQHLLPQAQRRVLTRTNDAHRVRTSIEITTMKLHNLAEELPRDDFIEEQKRTQNIITALHTMKNAIETKKSATSSQSHNSALMQTDATTTAHTVSARLAAPALDAAAATRNVNDPVAMLQTETSYAGSLRDKVTHALDHAIELFKESRNEQLQQASDSRDMWSDELEEMQNHLESLMQDKHAHLDLAYDYLAFAVNLKEYLKAITSQQYHWLDYYSAIKSNVIHFGQHFDKAVRMRASLVPLFEEVLHWVENGDVAYAPSPRTGCDGEGAVEDACGVCRGDNTTCLACDGATNGDSLLDVCGVCGDGQGHTCRYFCDAKPNSGRVEDLCGVCDGNDKQCTGCDNLPHSPLTYDTCGVCGGDGKACAKQKGCANLNTCSTAVKCPPGKTVTSHGFAHCCFDARLDCVNTTFTM